MTVPHRTVRQLNLCIQNNCSVFIHNKKPLYTTTLIQMSYLLSVCEDVMLRNIETKDDYLSGDGQLESLRACFALTLVTMTSIKTGCDDSPSPLSPSVPNGRKSSRSKSSWLTFPQRAWSYHSCFLCRCQEVYSQLMCKFGTVAYYSVTSCMLLKTLLLLVQQVEEFHVKYAT